MTSEEYYNKIRRQLGTQALLSYQIDSCRLYGKDAICKMLEDYHQAKLNLLTIPVVSNQRELLIALKEHCDNREERGYILTEFVIDEFLESNK